ncbi:MAG: AAA family ATPase, partial [Bacilli bacterium]|nr:AAA family ATPase [Bacilli bacterium]
MLIQFKFENYKSFKDETILDMSAAKITEFSDRVVSVGNGKILPVAAIYGANASGKSNVYSAFKFMSNYVEESFRYGDDEDKYKEFKPTPFLFDSASSNGKSVFEVFFT